MNISKIKAVIFDCDGVLFDTAQANRKFYNEVLKHFSKPSLTQEQFNNVHMMTVAEATFYLFPEMDDLSPVYEFLKQTRYNKFIPYMQMEEGLIPLLKAIKQRGWIRGIATNRTDTMEKVLITFNIKSLFEIVVTAMDVAKPKPDPEQLLKIMDHYSFNPDEIVFIGDSIFDQKAAQAAGTWFIGFKNPDLSPGLSTETFASSMEEVQRLLHLTK